MLDSKFYLSLLAITLLSLTLIWIFDLVVALRPSCEISLISIAFFALLSIVIHHVAKRAAQSSNKNLLTQFVMIVVFVKMATCLLLIVGYDRIYRPESRYFIIPFLTYYIIYTIFEVYVVTKANKLTT